MAWNHRSAVVAMAIAIQPTPGTFNAPNTTTDLIAAAQVTNSVDALTATDPTVTGSIWQAPDINLGQKATVGGTIPLRGPAGASPPAGNAWVPGRVMQACGWSETIKATATTGVTLQAGSSTTALVLANTESATDNFLLGAPVKQANLGSGFTQYSIIRSYVGASKTAQLAETMGVAPSTGDAYEIPAHMRYVLGTLTSAPPLLSISVWRDKKRYDYRDWSPTQWKLDIPVSNDANTNFPSIEFSGNGQLVAEADDTTPAIPSALIQIALAPVRAGKFFLDKVKLGHQQLTFTTSMEVGAASNQNATPGQDGYDILSGQRTVDLDLNQMNVSDFNVKSRVDAGTVMPVLSTWGIGAGNNFGFMMSNLRLNPLNNAERNGYVSITGNAVVTDVDKSAALAIWW